MKKLLSRIFVALAIIGMVTFIAPKKAIAEQAAPDCIQVLVACPDGSLHGYAVVCDQEQYDLLMEIYCNIKVKPGTGPCDD